ncbi:MAG: serine/threonine-protein phosphatase [Kiritimatiellae bacterium]|nr:serine/threonine-protein phosphatase [Kiritimatiellia bacterium]
MGAFSHLKCAAASDIGRKRKNNEDSFGVFPEAGFFCVADGMGGGDDGEVASAATVRAIEDFTASHPQPDNAGYSAERYADGICRALVVTSGWIYDRTQEKHLKGCGSTFVGVCFDPTRPAEALALHAGDSRLYRIRGRSIQRITRDHSAAELIGAKDEDDINPMFRGMILRAVGIQPVVDVERTPVQVKFGDKLVICSDGLYRMVPEKKIVSILRAAETPDDAVKTLIDAANEAGGIDNVTAVLVEVGELPQPLPVAELKIETSEEPTRETLTAEPKTCETGDPVTRDTDTGSGAIFGEVGVAKPDEPESPGQDGSKDPEKKPESAPSIWTRILGWFASRKKKD